MNASAARLLSMLLQRLGEEELAGVEDDRLVADEVGDRDGVGDDVGEGSVAAVGDGPDGAADGGGAVAAAGAELAVGAGFQQLEGLARGDRRVAGLVSLAQRVGGRALERGLGGEILTPVRPLI